MMRRLVLIIFLLTGSLILNAQKADPKTGTDPGCLADLKEAEYSFQNGLFSNCIKLLEGTLSSCKLSRSEKVQAFELLAESYIETDELDKAESTVNLMLLNFPHYELEEADNSESFNRMVKKYKIHPLFSIGAKNTGDWLKHKTTKVYSVLDGLDYSQPIDDNGYFFTYYGVAEYEFIDGLSANIDLMFFWSRYNRYFVKDPGFDLSYWESDYFIEFPVYLKKYFHLGRNFFVYTSGGIGLFYTYQALGNVILKYTKDDIITGKNSDFYDYLYEIDMLGMRNKFLGQWNAGVGIGYKLKNLRFFLDARYLGVMGSITAPERSDLNPKLKNEFFYIDNSMKINQFEVGATISYTIFNSVKRIRK